MQSTLRTYLATPESTPFHETAIGNVSLVIAATGFLAICAHVSIPLFFTPVPLSLITFGVLLVGMTLGPVAGFSAMLLYLAEGAAGMPMFSPSGPGGLAQLLGPTAGYLFSYPLAAAVAGALARTTGSIRARFLSACIAGTAATVCFFVMGAPWLSHWMHLSPSATMKLAVFPFLPGEVIKIAAAAGIFSAVRLSRRS